MMTEGAIANNRMYLKISVAVKMSLSLRKVIKFIFF